MKILDGIKEYFKILSYLFKYGEEEGQIKWRIEKLKEMKKEE